MKQVYNISELVPHSGKMLLLDEVSNYGDDWLEATVAITPRSMFAGVDGVPACVGLEYMAQCVAAFAGIRERRNNKAPKLGFLLGTRKYSCDLAVFPVGSTIALRAEREMEADNGLSVFNCTLICDGVTVTATLNVFQPEDAEKFLKEGSR